MTPVIGRPRAARDAWRTGSFLFSQGVVMRLSAVVFALVVASAVLTAAVDPPRTIDIVATEDMKYSVTTIKARAGETIRVRLVAKGVLPKIAMAHNFVLLKTGTNIDKLLKDGAPSRASDFIPPTMMDAVIAKTGFAGPGEMVQVTFTVPKKPGSYPYICTFSGHYQGGMKGTLIVK
jgi:azurin